MQRQLNSQRLMLHQLFRALQTREAEIAEDETDIRRQIDPFRKGVLAWMQIPGIDEVTAWSLVAEMGPDMAPFETASKPLRGPASVPAITKAVAKQGDDRTRKGKPWLRSAICEALGARLAPRSPISTRNTLGSAHGAVRDEHSQTVADFRTSALRIRNMAYMA